MSSKTILLFLLACVELHAQEFLFVKLCPQTKAEWEKRKAEKNCKEPTPDYHCAAIESTHDQFGEICSNSALTLNGYCPILNAMSYNLNYKKCIAYNGCPQNPYSSDEIYKHPICFSLFNPPQQSTEVPEKRKCNDEMVVRVEGAGIGIAVSLFIAVVVIVFLYIRKKKKKKKQKRTYGEAPLTLLA